MKIGDKVLCIRTIAITKKDNMFEYGQSYKIVSIFEESNKIYLEYIGRDGDYYMSGFVIKEVQEWRTFSEYFIDLKKERKLKLDKINGSSL